SGVHPNVIKAIRKADQIKRVIFIACDAEAAKANFINLCRPSSNSFVGKPFTPKKALPFDLFPHTLHCELLLSFER
ncbi:10986_t:CDS:2, partial [Ambispora leptoticha]